MSQSASIDGVTNLLLLRLRRISASPDAPGRALSLVDIFTIPKANGDSTVLLLSHPGTNMLGQFFSVPKVNEIILANSSTDRTHSIKDEYKVAMDEERGDGEDVDSQSQSPRHMDLITFFE